MGPPITKPEGRRKGKPNNLTKNIKLIIIDVFERLGGIDGFVEWGKENRGEFYKIWIKMLPPQKQQNENTGLTIQIVQFGKENDFREITNSQTIEIKPTEIHGEDGEQTDNENAETLRITSQSKSV